MDLDALAGVAIALLEAELGDDERSHPRPAGSERIRSLALQYAEHIVRQREIREDFEAASADPSSLHAQIGEEDRARIYEYALARSGTRLDARVVKWQRIARTIVGRPDTLVPEEYKDMLDRRDALDQIRSMLLPASQRLLDERIEAPDDAFVAGTRSVATALEHEERWRSAAWWW